MTDEDITQPCLHCAVYALLKERQQRGINDEPEEVLLRMTEIMADIAASFDGYRRGDLVEIAAQIGIKLFGEVLMSRWKVDINAGPGTENTKRH